LHGLSAENVTAITPWFENLFRSGVKATLYLSWAARPASSKLFGVPEVLPFRLPAWARHPSALSSWTWAFALLLWGRQRLVVALVFSSIGPDINQCRCGD